MNILRQLKQTPNIVGNLIQQTTRNYAVIKLPIKWVPPKEVSCIDPERSGDRGIDFDIKPEDPIRYFEKSEELKKADELVKKMFSVGFNRRNAHIQLRREKSMELVKRHAHDRGSMESRIARMTAQILQMQEHQKFFWQNSKTKIYLKELIEKRNKHLKFLRRQDYARFEFLLERLNLVYKPYPEDNPNLTERICTKRLLQKHCDGIIQKKLDDYRKELESQQAAFFKEKAEKLEFIRNEELACGVKPTITEANVEAAKQKAATFIK